MTSTRKAPELTVHAASSVGAALVALLVPKCPLCVAAYLGAFGASAAVAHGAAPFVRPVALLAAAMALVALGIGAWRARKTRRTASCCGELRGSV